MIESDFIIRISFHVMITPTLWLYSIYMMKNIRGAKPENK